MHIMQQSHIYSCISCYALRLPAPQDGGTDGGCGGPPLGPRPPLLLPSLPCTWSCQCQGKTLNVDTMEQSNPKTRAIGQQVFLIDILSDTNAERKKNKHHIPGKLHKRPVRLFEWPQGSPHPQHGVAPSHLPGIIRRNTYR